MDLITLTALYPVAKDLIERVPQVRKWMEERADKEDPTLFMQLQIMQTVSELRTYILASATISAMLSNLDLIPEQVKERFVKASEVARDILTTIRGVAP